ncbi:MAG: WecB/TagA/CpsF family glycosyltransferase [Candidatus Thiodiazotropha sp.]
MSSFLKYPVIDTSITSTTKFAAINEILRRIESNEGGYICFVNAHVSVMTRQSVDLKRAINEATLALPDGMPVYLIGKFRHSKEMEKISGPDFLHHIFDHTEGRMLRHFFYGGTEEVLSKMIQNLEMQYPGCNIVGSISPPFREMSEEETSKHFQLMESKNAQIVWVGLGAPKQELWMHDNSKKLPGVIFMGVGAAFDFSAGNIARAPKWIQNCGLEWLHRLAQEPRRLWRRYLITNTLFVFYTVIGVIKKGMFNK